VIILDASVLIAHLDDKDAHHERARELLLATSSLPWGASPVTLAEVLGAPTRVGRLELTAAGLRKLKIQRVPLSETSPELLARLRVETNLKLPDCCVIHAAEQVGAGTVATFDDRLAMAARQRGLTVAN
jgi:predicted nucleic acid-binding protein